MTNNRICVVLATLTLAGYGSAVFPQANCNVGVEHYPEGPLKQCVLNGHHTFYTAKGHRVTCADGKTLVQHRNGSMESCSIDKPHTFGGVHCEAPARVEFDADGQFVTCRRG